MSDKESSISDMQRIAAFADGELTGEENLRVLEQSQSDPQVAGRIRHQQHLRRACQRVMRQPQACPDDVRRRIEALAMQPGDAQAASPVLARIGRWVPAAIAAVLLLGAILVYRDALVGRPSLDTLLPATRIDTFDRRHDTCSKSLAELHNLSQYPEDLTALPRVLSDKFGQAVPSLDLSELGYHFQGIGDCIIPGTQSVHLIYKANPSSGHADSVSLWLAADDGELPIEPGRLYTRSSTQPGQKLLLWKAGGVVYYLLGDEPQRLDVVAESLRHVG